MMKLGFEFLDIMQYRLRHPSFVTLTRATFSQGPGEGKRLVAIILKFSEYRSLQ